MPHHAGISAMVQWYVVPVDSKLKRSGLNGLLISTCLFSLFPLPCNLYTKAYQNSRLGFKQFFFSSSILFD